MQFHPSDQKGAPASCLGVWACAVAEGCARRVLYRTSRGGSWGVTSDVDNCALDDAFLLSAPEPQRANEATSAAGATYAADSLEGSRAARGKEQDGACEVEKTAKASEWAARVACFLTARGWQVFRGDKWVPDAAIALRQVLGGEQPQKLSGATGIAGVL